MRPEGAASRGSKPASAGLDGTQKGGVSQPGGLQSLRLRPGPSTSSGQAKAGSVTPAGEEGTSAPFIECGSLSLGGPLRLQAEKAFASKRLSCLAQSIRGTHRHKRGFRQKVAPGVSMCRFGKHRIGFHAAQQHQHVALDAVQRCLRLPFKTQNQHRRGVGRANQAKAVWPVDPHTVDY